MPSEDCSGSLRTQAGEAAGLGDMHMGLQVRPWPQRPAPRRQNGRTRRAGRPSKEAIPSPRTWLFGLPWLEVLGRGERGFILSAVWGCESPTKPHDLLQSAPSPVRTPARVVPVPAQVRGAMENTLLISNSPFQV